MLRIIMAKPSIAKAKIAHQVSFGANLADTVGMLYRLLLLLLTLPATCLAVDCPRSFAQVDGIVYHRLPQAPLEDLIRATGLNPEQMKLLRENARAVIGVEDFLKLRPTLGQGYLLAKDNMNQTAKIFSNPKGLRHWMDGYDSVGMRMRWKHPDPAYHTPEFLTKITEKDEPIVFLVPPGIMDGTTGFTRAEMRWALWHPERLHNVIFVFGAYNFLPPEFLEKFAYKPLHDELKKLLQP